MLPQVPGEAEAALHRLQAKLATARGPLPRQAALTAAIEGIALLMGHLGAWGVPSARVMLEPMMRPPAEFYSGVLCEVHLVHPETKACTLFAVGEPPPLPAKQPCLRPWHEDDRLVRRHGWGLHGDCRDI